MIKVEYPFAINNSTVSKDDFKEKYYFSLKKKVDETKLNVLLNSVKFNGKKLCFRKLLTADFTELIKIFKLIEKNKNRESINKYFEKIINGKKVSIYNSAQGDISKFFMIQNIALKTCHYCNIDYINIFEERYSYANLKDFLNYAPREILLTLDSISNNTAKIIILARPIVSVFDCLKRDLTPRIYEKLKDELNTIDLDNILINKNHFTLDHFLPKIDFPYLSLSLFNLVPSCSSCNCKFKGSLEFLPTDQLNFLSPTSDQFTLDNDFEFKLFFNVIGNNLDSSIENVSSPNDFLIQIVDKKNSIGFNTYLNMFKLKGRYEFHKNVALKMIVKRKSYSDSQIKELSDLFINKGMNKDEKSIKKDLFGTAIFNDYEKNESFAKYNKDIAKQLGIIP